MAEQKQFPAWVQEALGVVLGTAILGIGVAAWNDRALDARRDERLHHIETSFTEFSKPGKRYAQSDGDRDRLVAERRIEEVKENIRELKTEFNLFRNAHLHTTTVKLNEVAVKLEALQHMVYPRTNGYVNHDKQ
jgi:hypothetical protein